METGIIEKIFVKKMKQGKNRTIVELYLNNEMDLFAKFSYVNDANYFNKNSVKINNEIINYIITETENIPLRNNLAISIKYLYQVNYEVKFIEKIIKENINEKLSTINKEIKKLNLKSFVLAWIGMMLIGITQIFQIFERRYSINEFIIVMSWVFMWKAVDLIFFERVKLMKEKGTLLKIYCSEIFMERLGNESKLPIN